MQYLDKMILCDQSPYVTSDGDWTHGRLQGQQENDIFDLSWVPKEDGKQRMFVPQEVAIQRIRDFMERI